MGQIRLDKEQTSEAVMEVLERLADLSGMDNDEFLGKLEQWTKEDHGLGLEEFCQEQTNIYVDKHSGDIFETHFKIERAVSETTLRPGEAAKAIRKKQKKKERKRETESKTDKWVRRIRNEEAVLADVQENVSKPTYYKIRRIVQEFDHVDADRPYRKELEQ